MSGSTYLMCIGLGVVAAFVLHFRGRPRAGIVLALVTLVIAALRLLPGPLGVKAGAQHEACVANLQSIQSAIDQWAAANQKSPKALVNIGAIRPHMKKGGFLTCPAGGTYSMSTVEEPPKCSVSGHALHRR